MLKLSAEVRHIPGYAQSNLDSLLPDLTFLILFLVENWHCEQLIFQVAQLPSHYLCALLMAFFTSTISRGGAGIRIDDTGDLEFPTHPSPFDIVQLCFLYVQRGPSFATSRHPTIHITKMLQGTSQPAHDRKTIRPDREIEENENVPMLSPTHSPIHVYHALQSKPPT